MNFDKNFYFFDVNCMIGKWPAPKLHFETAKGLTERMSYLGIKKALVFHSIAWKYDSLFGNRQLLKEIESCNNLSETDEIPDNKSSLGRGIETEKEKLLPLPVVTPYDTPKGILGEETVELLKTKACAVKLFPRDHNYSFSQWNIGPMLEKLETMKLPVFIDYEQIRYNEIRIEDLFWALKGYPKLPFVLCSNDHSYRIGRILYPLFERFKNFYIETSTFLLYQGIEEICSRFGSERILFGSGMPFQDGGGSIARVLYAEIDNKDKQNIAYKNAERLLLKK